MNSREIFLPSRSKNDRLCNKLFVKLSKAYEYKNYGAIKSLLGYYSIPVLVKALEKLSNYELINIAFLTVEQDRMRDLFLSFSDNYKLGILNTMRPIVLSKLLAQLQADQVVELLSMVDSNLSKKIIYLASPELRKNVSIISNFSHSQVGSIMNTSILTIQANLKISQALTYIRKRRHKLDIENELFVVNLSKEVVGMITLQDLFFSPNNSLTVQEIMEKDYITFRATDQIGEIVDAFQKYPISSIAVLNERNQILGVVNNKDILPEIVEENMEDVYKFYGIVNLTHSYMKSTTWEVVRSRLFWLVILLFATTLTTLIIDKFEDLGFKWTMGISSAILVPMIPLITDMCGNSGSQTAASIIQSFASDELKGKDFLHVLKKELKISLVVGGIVSLVNFARLSIYYWFFPISTGKLNFLDAKLHSRVDIRSFLHYAYIQYVQPLVKFFGNTENTGNTEWMGIIGSLVSSLSLFFVIILSKLLGVVIPYIAHKFKRDPAALTTPVLTTILDAIGTLIFFSIGVGVIYLSMHSLLPNYALSSVSR
ncbi:Magnesium transporter [Mycoplasma suis KI3806]|uniref:Magnesium transporter n=1 Tax=Mycoplasma suis (strain KI_3806) TaxID=708248 RepID=F0V1G5_MYCS3|nr:magnesium transporter [Mycoplasma suis]CBZ40496.1 Magnesium transporter [Mycoplasma suis KI3806]